MPPRLLPPELRSEAQYSPPSSFYSSADDDKESIADSLLAWRAQLPKTLDSFRSYLLQPRNSMTFGYLNNKESSPSACRGGCGESQFIPRYLRTGDDDDNSPYNASKYHINCPHQQRIHHDLHGENTLEPVTAVGVESEELEAPESTPAFPASSEPPAEPSSTTLAPELEAAAHEQPSTPAAPQPKQSQERVERMKEDFRVMVTARVQNLVKTGELEVSKDGLRTKSPATKRDAALKLFGKKESGTSAITQADPATSELEADELTDNTCMPTFEEVNVDEQQQDLAAPMERRRIDSGLAVVLDDNFLSAECLYPICQGCLQPNGLYPCFCYEFPSFGSHNNVRMAPFHNLQTYYAANSGARMTAAERQNLLQPATSLTADTVEAESEVRSTKRLNQPEGVRAFCTNCGKHGHWKKECKAPKAYPRYSFCGKCFQPGHWAHSCPKFLPTCKHQNHLAEHCPKAKCEHCGGMGHAAKDCWKGQGSEHGGDGRG